MKNVKLSVKLRCLSKSVAATCLLIIFAFAGSAFNTFNNAGAHLNGADARLANNSKNYKNLFDTANYSDPTILSVTVLNPQAISFVQQYIRNEGEQLVRMKVWGKPYFDMYDDIFDEYNLPKQLKYLSVIESSLVHDIKSPAGAAGPWQIMAGEARRVGLKVNGKTDERLSFNKSTHAAAKILNELHGLFNDWLLVVAAYNCGEVRMQQAIKKSGSNNFWVLQSYLPAQTRAHVKRFIGTQYIFEGNGGLTTMTASQIIHTTATSGS